MQLKSWGRRNNRRLLRLSFDDPARNRTPGFALRSPHVISQQRVHAITVFALALGIGVNTAVFTH